MKISFVLLLLFFSSNSYAKCEHQVTKGETLITLAKKYYKNYGDPLYGAKGRIAYLIEINRHLPNPSLLREGDKIKVPCNKIDDLL